MTDGLLRSVYRRSPHLYDPRYQLPFTAHHNDPTLQGFIAGMVEAVNPDMWIETGTHMGWSTMWLAERFPNLQVHTVEKDDSFFSSAGENLAPYPNVKLYHDDSTSFLWKMLPELAGKLPIFFLDAHYEPPPPLKEECYAVARLDRWIILIDDFQAYAPDWSGATIYSRTHTEGTAWKCDLSYVASELLQPGVRHYRPCYEWKQGFNGVGVFIKGVNYVPPPTLFREETWEQFLATRPADALPIHPSAVWRFQKPTLLIERSTLVDDQVVVRPTWEGFDP